MSFELARAMRSVLLGDDPPVGLSGRAKDRLAVLRRDAVETVHPGGTVIVRDGQGDLRWWTWAGFRTNATLAATLSGVAAPDRRADDECVRLRDDVDPQTWKAALAEAVLSLPEVDERALTGLKFGVALPRRLAIATLAARLADLDHATAVLAEPTRWTTLRD